METKQCLLSYNYYQVWKSQGFKLCRQILDRYEGDEEYRITYYSSLISYMGGEERIVERVVYPYYNYFFLYPSERMLGYMAEKEFGGYWVSNYNENWVKEPAKVYKEELWVTTETIAQKYVTDWQRPKFVGKKVKVIKGDYSGLDGVVLGDVGDKLKVKISHPFIFIVGDFYKHYLEIED